MAQQKGQTVLELALVRLEFFLVRYYDVNGHVQESFQGRDVVGGFLKFQESVYRVVQ